jgi:hypothetical protein
LHSFKTKSVTHADTCSAILQSYFCAFVNANQMPEYLGPSSEVTTFMQNGKLFSEAASDTAREVISVTAQDLSKLSYDLSEGIYVVGSGSTGAGTALAVCGGLYFALMMTSAFAMKLPHPSYKPAGFEPAKPPTAASSSSGTKAVSPQAVVANVTPDTLLKTPQVSSTAFA